MEYLQSKFSKWSKNTINNSADIKSKCNNTYNKCRTETTKFNNYRISSCKDKVE